MKKTVVALAALLCAASAQAAPSAGRQAVFHTQKDSFGCFTFEALSTLLTSKGRAPGEPVDVQLLDRYGKDGRCSWLEAGRPVRIITRKGGWACVRPVEIRENRCLWIESPN